MKRERELKAVLTEVVETAKEKDDQGHPLYPFMQAPMVLAFFGAPDALFEVLVERPGIILNLIQTNKLLEAFWNQFHDIWIILMDALIEKEMGTYASEIYPFMAFSKEQTLPDEERLIYAQKEASEGDKYSTKYPYMSSSFNLVTIEGRRLRSNYPYYLVYHDPLTKLYLELLTLMEETSSIHKHGVSGRMEKYLKIDPRIGTVYVVYLPDALLVESSTKRALSFKYDLKEMRSEVKDISYVFSQLRVHEIQKGSSMVFVTRQFQETMRRQWPLATAKLLLNAISITKRLVILLNDSDLVLKPIEPIKLDENIAKPYRTLLYDPEQGLYKTQEAQKEFFTSTLADISRQLGRDKAIVKYGLLPCTLCHQETDSVDLATMRPFCTQKCRHDYSSLSS